MATFAEQYRIELGRLDGKILQSVHGILTSAGTEGGTAGDIPASVFGLSAILTCSDMVISTNATVVVTEPQYDGNGILTFETPVAAAATDVAAGAYQITLTGFK